MPEQAPAETPVEAPEGSVEPREGTPGDGDTTKGGKEARYRVERNEARVALASATARIEAFQTREIERLAGEHLSAPGDLLTLSGRALADFVDENGDIDAEAVEEAAREVLDSRPGLRKPAQAIDRSQGRGGTERSMPSWDALLQSSS